MTVEDAVLAAYERYAPSVSEVTADRCALAFREGFLAGHAAAEAEKERLQGQLLNREASGEWLMRELEAAKDEVRTLKLLNDTVEQDLLGYQSRLADAERSAEGLKAALHEVATVVSTGIPVDLVDTSAAWRRLRTALGRAKVG